MATELFVVNKMSTQHEAFYRQHQFKCVNYCECASKINGGIPGADWVCNCHYLLPNAAKALASDMPPAADQVKYTCSKSGLLHVSVFFSLHVCHCRIFLNCSLAHCKLYHLLYHTVVNIPQNKGGQRSSKKPTKANVYFY